MIKYISKYTGKEIDEAIGGMVSIVDNQSILLERLTLDENRISIVENKTTNLSPTGDTYTGKATRDGNGDVITTTYAKQTDFDSLDQTVSALSNSVQSHYTAIGQSISDISNDILSIQHDYATKQELSVIEVASVEEFENTSNTYKLKVSNVDGTTFTTPNLITGTPTTEATLFDCTSFTTIAAVEDELMNTRQWYTSTDGLSTFHQILPYDYTNEPIGAFYSSTYGGGLNFGSNTATYPLGAYSIIPFGITSNNTMIHFNYYVSTWINPTIEVAFISANSISEIPTKIANRDYAWSTQCTLSASQNDTDFYLPCYNVPSGVYYIFIRVNSDPGGNERIIKKMRIVNY